MATVSSWGGKNKRDEKGNKKSKIKNHLLPATKGKEGELGGRARSGELAAVPQ